jgi:hypothetical protein
MKWSENNLKVLKSPVKWSGGKCSEVQRREGRKRGEMGIYHPYIWVVNWWEAKDWCNKHVCNMMAKTLETIYSTFFTSCCIPYVQFWELYLSCEYCCHLMRICCILCLFVVNVCVFVVLLCVFVVSHVYFLYFLCVFVVLCVYCCSYFRCRTAG